MLWLKLNNDDNSTFFLSYFSLFYRSANSITFSSSTLRTFPFSRKCKFFFESVANREFYGNQLRSVFSLLLTLSTLFIVRNLISLKCVSFPSARLHAVLREMKEKRKSENLMGCIRFEYIFAFNVFEITETIFSVVETVETHELRYWIFCEISDPASEREWYFRTSWEDFRFHSNSIFVRIEIFP